MSRDKKLDFKEDEFIFRGKFNVPVFLKISRSGGSLKGVYPPSRVTVEQSNLA